jgi:hypothetical protein
VAILTSHTGRCGAVSEGMERMDIFDRGEGLAYIVPVQLTLLKEDLIAAPQWTPFCLAASMGA